MMLIFESKRHFVERDLTKCIIEPNKLQIFPRYINEKITDSRKGTFWRLLWLSSSNGWNPRKCWKERQFKFSRRLTVILGYVKLRCALIKHFSLIALIVKWCWLVIIAGLPPNSMNLALMRFIVTCTYFLTLFCTQSSVR